MDFTFVTRTELPTYMNAEQIASYLGVSKTSVYEMMHTKGFPMVRIGRRIIVASKDLLSWIDRNTEK